MDKIISDETIERSPIGQVMHVNKLVRTYAQCRVREIELQPGQDALLDAMNADTALSVKALSEILCVRPSTVSKMLDRLRRDGLIERCRFDHDGRSSGALLTPAGVEKRKLVRALKADMENDLFGELPEAEVRALRETLLSFEDAIMRRLRRLR